MASEAGGDVSPTGESQSEDGRLGFDRRVRLEFHGSKISSDGGLLLFRELDDVLGLHDLMGEHLVDTRTGHNRLHAMVGLARQSVFGRLGGYEDVNDADRLAFDPVMRQIVGKPPVSLSITHNFLPRPLPPARCRSSAIARAT